MLKQLLILHLYLISINTTYVLPVAQKLELLLNFMDEYHHNMNIDAIFGLTLSEAHLRVALDEMTDEYFQKYLLMLINKSVTIRQKVMPFLPKTPPKMLLFESVLLTPKNWTEHVKPFQYGQIKNWGTYNWTVSDILKDRSAIFEGIQTDVCISELLLFSKRNTECFVSPFCQKMMLGLRSDFGYLLTHRLLYQQIVELKGCLLKQFSKRYYTNHFCSLIYKEAKTSALLHYPYHDKFLEQVLLCGTEGYAEFMNSTWIKEILSWQEAEGCFKSLAEDFSKRTSNIIDFGCSDHSTGLASGVLAIYLRFLLLL